MFDFRIELDESPPRVPPPLAKSIKAMRKARGLAQVDLCEIVGIGQSMLSRYETGESLPNVEVFGRIAEACGYKIIVAPA